MTEPTKKTRIAVLDAHTLFAESLCLVLTRGGHEALQIPVPAHTANCTALLAAILRRRPDVVILNIELGTGWNVGTLIEGLADAGVAIVAVTEVSDPARWGEALAHGARLVLPKDGPLSAVTSALRRIDAHMPLMELHQRLGLLEAYRAEGRERSDHRARLETLSPRESEILNYLMAGMTVSVIVEQCAVSEGTVRTQIKAVLGKLNVTSQIAAVGMAHHVRWQPRDSGRHASQRAARRQLRAHGEPHRLALAPLNG